LEVHKSSEEIENISETEEDETHSIAISLKKRHKCFKSHFDSDYRRKHIEKHPETTIPVPTLATTSNKYPHKESKIEFQSNVIHPLQMMSSLNNEMRHSKEDNSALKEDIENSSPLIHHDEIKLKPNNITAQFTQVSDIQHTSNLFFSFQQNY
jgi:hypothetical protein